MFVNLSLSSSFDMVPRFARHQISWCSWKVYQPIHVSCTFMTYVWPLSSTSRSNRWRLFGTWVYQHKAMCRIHSLSPIRLWPLTSRSNLLGFWVASCLGHSIFVLWHNLTKFLHENINMGRYVTYIYYLCMTLTFGPNIRIIFSLVLVSGEDGHCLLTKTYQIWHMGVTPWDNMLCTFMTFVWPLPLTYMWVVRSIFKEFYSQFLSCLSHVLQC